MVTTRINRHATIIRDKFAEAIAIFGRTLTLRTVTRTLDNFGKLSAVTTSDTTFNGDLQFGTDLDQSLISGGFVEVGEGVLYVHPDQDSVTLQSRIVDGNAEWEVLDRIEAPDVGGTNVFNTYRCRRIINASD